MIMEVTNLSEGDAELLLEEAGGDPDLGINHTQFSYWNFL